MDDRTESRMPRLAPLLLVGVLTWLAVARPGNLAAHPDSIYWLLTTLTAVAAVGYIAWRFHGLIPATAAIILFRFADPTAPSSNAIAERGWDAVLIATLVLGIAGGSRQGRKGIIPWVLLALVAVGIALFGWLGWEMLQPTDEVARDRMRHVALTLVSISVVIGFLARGIGWRDRARLIAVAILIPAAGVVAARQASGDWPRLIEGGEWNTVVTEWQAAIRNGTWNAGAWCWTTPLIAVVLVLVGLWRTVSRGRKELRMGRPPLAWLVAATSIGIFVAVGARPLASGSLALAAVGSILSVFGVADLIQAVVERIELKPPE